MGRGLRLSLAEARRLGLVLPAPARACPAAPSPIQQRLWLAVQARWPEARAEYRDAVPGRRFTLDIAFPARQLAIEVDGWQYHGKYKRDFQRDREKDRLLLLAGWRVMRFFAAEIRADLPAVLAQIHQILEKTV